jgi:hypothetical protein
MELNLTGLKILLKYLKNLKIARATTSKSNMLESRQCALIYFSSLMGFNNLLEPNTLLKIFLGPHANLLVFYTDSISIILSRTQPKISQRWNCTLAPPLHKKTRLLGYKYTIILQTKRFHNLFIFDIFSILIFRVYFSKILLYFLYTYWLKYLRVSTSIK